MGQPLRLEDDTLRDGGVLVDAGQAELLDTTRAIEAYSDVVSYSASRTASANFRSHERDATAAETGSSSSTTNLYKRTVTYTVIGVTCLLAGNIIAAAIYATQPIRVANLAILIAFIGLLLFITFSGIAFLTIPCIGQANAKKILASYDQPIIDKDVSKRGRLLQHPWAPR